MSDTTWSHRIARPMVRPLVRTSVTPNHLTTIRLITGICAAVAFAAGEPRWTAVGGLLFVLSTFLDSADGELARLSCKCSSGGDRFDVASDVGTNALVFLGIGLGERSGMFGGWAIAMGAVAALGVLAIYVAMTLIETIEGEEKPVLPGAVGFSPDDALYLVGPIAWLGWLGPLVAAASVGAPVAAAILCVRYWRLRVSAPSSVGGAGVRVAAPAAGVRRRWRRAELGTGSPAGPHLEGRPGDHP